MGAKLSVLGLYNWDHDIFSDMALPDGVNADTLTWKILEDCAELEIIYSDPDYLKESLKHWSSAMLPNWKKMAEALTAEYNPIWNKDGTTRETNTYGAIVQSGTGSGNTSSTEKDNVAGFNSDTAHTREERSGYGTQNTSASNRQEAHTDTREVIEQGNIGVTESSAMVRHEIELRSDYNIYSIICNDFKKHYCLMVY